MMKRYFILFSSVVALTFTLTACWDDSDPMNATPSADLLRTNEITLAAEATEGEIPMNTNCPWTATTQSDWLTVVTTSGVGNGTVRLNTSRNTWAAERTAIVTLTTQGGIRRNLKVKQLGSEARLQVSPLSLLFAALEGQATFTIHGNVSWAIRSEHDWLTGFSALEGRGDSVVTFLCTDNYSVQPRSGKIVILNEEYSLRQEILVTQEAGELPVVGELQWDNFVEQQAMFTCKQLSSMFPVEEYGICYAAENTFPTTADHKVNCGYGIPQDGTFTATLANLTVGATYYARAYAISAAGTGYGPTFTFDATPLPGNGDNLRPNY